MKEYIRFFAKSLDQLVVNFLLIDTIDVEQ